MATDARKHRVLSDSSSDTKVMDQKTNFLNPLNSVNVLYILRTVISFYLRYMNNFVLFGQVPAPSCPEKRGPGVYAFRNNRCHN